MLLCLLLSVVASPLFVACLLWLCTPEPVANYTALLYVPCVLLHFGLRRKSELLKPMRFLCGTHAAAAFQNTCLKNLVVG